MNRQPSKYGNATGRWAGFGPYYAMFPVKFASTVIDCMSSPGSRILDPFCGRGTVPFIAQTTGRESLGIDVNPVAWVFSKVKTDPEVDVEKLLNRVREVQENVCDVDSVPVNEFQEWAWSNEVLGYLNAARRILDWRSDRTDRTLMGFLLVNVHASKGAGLSNQMQNSRSMGPDYAVRWWKSRSLPPPEYDPVTRIGEKIEWRYKHGVVGSTDNTQIKLGNSENILESENGAQFNMLFTSPPYCKVTDYRQDSWIRLWLLNEAGPLPDWKKDPLVHNSESYIELIDTVLSVAKQRLTPRAVVWIRTDSRKFTKQVTLEAVRRNWPKRKLLIRQDVPKNGTQTDHYKNGSSSKRLGEVDIVLPGHRKLPFQESNWEELKTGIYT